MVESGLDMDIMPFAVPLRMKSACGDLVSVCAILKALWVTGGTHLFDAIHERIVNVE